MKRWAQTFLVGSLLAILIAPCLSLAAYPAPQGYVTDTGEMLSAEMETQLETELATFEADTQHQVAVVTVPSLSGDYIEHYAVELFKAWGIGKKGADNGVLFLVAKEERAVRIEVGYGLEGVLTDSIASSIIRNQITPEFQRGDFDAGVRAGVSAIMLVAKGEVLPQQEQSPVSEGIMKFFMGNVESLFILPYLLFMFLAGILSRSSSWWLGGVMGGVGAAIIGALFGMTKAGLPAAAILVPLGLMFDYIVSKKFERSTQLGVQPPWWAGGSGGLRGGFGGGGGGFRGFGGGRSGGGGASGSW